MTSVYLASRYQDRDFMLRVKELLEGAGYTVTSRWLMPGDDQDMLKLRGKDAECATMAQRDFEDIDAADIFVVNSLKGSHGNGSGGRHVELGYAMAKGKPVVVVGEQENIFHYHPMISVCGSYAWLREALTHVQNRVG